MTNRTQDTISGGLRKEGAGIGLSGDPVNVETLRGAADERLTGEIPGIRHRETNYDENKGSQRRGGPFRVAFPTEINVQPRYVTQTAV